jgi:hypothetical protein
MREKDKVTREWHLRAMTSWSESRSRASAAVFARTRSESKSRARVSAILSPWAASSLHVVSSYRAEHAGNKLTLQPACVLR